MKGRRTVMCAGGIVLGDSSTVALVRNRKDTLWFFPKGHSQEGEDPEDAARREIEEETGLKKLEYLDDLGVYERPGILHDNTYNADETKMIHMFLFAAHPHAEIVADNEIEDVKWMPLQFVASELEDAKDCAWFATVFERVRQAIQRD